MAHELSSCDLSPCHSSSQATACLWPTSRMSRTACKTKVHTAIHLQARSNGARRSVRSASGGMVKPSSNHSNPPCVWNLPLWSAAPTLQTWPSPTCTNTWWDPTYPGKTQQGSTQPTPTSNSMSRSKWWCITAHFAHVLNMHHYKMRSFCGFPLVKITKSTLDSCFTGAFCSHWIHLGNSPS